MIVDNGKYYLYRHIRLDKNEPFYIGVGTKNNKFAKGYRSLYLRAYNRKTRNKIWWDIVKKTEYEVEILLESDNYDFIKQKEIEFVKLYGRINLKTGTLSNLTDGGDSNIGVVLSEETKKKMSENHRSRGKFGSDNELSKEIYQYNLHGNFIKKFIGIREAYREMNVSPSSISSCLRGKSLTCSDSMWFYEFRGTQILPSPRKVNSKRNILMIDISSGSILNEFDSASDAARFINGDPGTIIHVCKNRRKSFKGYKWKYKE